MYNITKNCAECGKLYCSNCLPTICECVMITKELQECDICLSEKKEFIKCIICNHEQCKECYHFYFKKK